MNKVYIPLCNKFNNLIGNHIVNNKKKIYRLLYFFADRKRFVARIDSPDRFCSRGCFTMSQAFSLNALYKKMQSIYGVQGWWPLYDKARGGCAYGITGGPVFPRAFEVAVGAILTQNIAWANVEKSIVALHEKGLMSPERMGRSDDGELAVLIRPCGYYNQKVRSLRALLAWLDENGEHFIPADLERDDSLRKSLLSVRGIGPETADSILLYGLGYRYFVIDAYTRRIFYRLGLVPREASYHDIQALCHRRFRGDVNDYREFHAVIVRHGADVCRKRPGCQECPLMKRCPAGRGELSLD